jgi:tetratricopeptide (TPR) repeat protein
VHARIAEAAVLAGDHERALSEAELAERLSDAELHPTLRALLHRVRGYAFLLVGRRDKAEREFEQSVEAARSADALYELALSLRAEETLRGEAGHDGEAQRLLDALNVTCVPNVPTAESAEGGADAPPSASEL